MYNIERLNSENITTELFQQVLSTLDYLDEIIFFENDALQVKLKCVRLPLNPYNLYVSSVGRAFDEYVGRKVNLIGKSNNMVELRFEDDQELDLAFDECQIDRFVWGNSDDIQASSQRAYDSANNGVGYLLVKDRHNLQIGEKVVSVTSSGMEVRLSVYDAADSYVPNTLLTITGHVSNRLDLTLKRSFPDGSPQSIMTECLDVRRPAYSCLKDITIFSQSFSMLKDKSSVRVRNYMDWYINIFLHNTSLDKSQIVGVGDSLPRKDESRPLLPSEVEMKQLPNYSGMRASIKNTRTSIDLTYPHVYLEAILKEITNEA